MKKIFTFAVFVFLMIFPAAADNEDVMKAVSLKIDIPKNYTEVYNHVDMGKNQKLTYLTWYGETTDEMPGGSLNVTVDEKNRIIGFNQYQYGNYSGDYKLASISYDEAVAIARSRLEKMCPEFISQIKPTPHKNYYSRKNRDYYIQFYRYINGVPYYDNYLNVSVSPVTGDISSMEVSWHDIDTVAPAENLYTSYLARNNYYEHIGLRLGYQNIPGTDRYMLQYFSNFSGREYISAASGTLINSRYLPEKSLENYKRIYFGYPDISYSEQTAGGGYVPEDFLEAYIRSVPEFGISDKYLLQYSYYLNGSDGTGYTLMDLFADMGSSNTTVILNSKTKELIRFEHYSDDQPEGVLKTDEQCLEMAKAFCEKFAPELLAQCDKPISFTDYWGDFGVYSVYFPRKVNGVPLWEDGLYVSVDRITGNITKFSSVKTSGFKLDSAADIISPKQAYAKMVDKIEFELQYVAAAKKEVITPVSDNDLQLVLVYNFKHGTPVFVDAKTGELMSGDGSEIKTGVFDRIYEDIEGHPLQKQIETLYYCGILPYSPQFMPDELITAGDFLRYGYAAVKGNDIQNVTPQYIFSSGTLREDEYDENASITNEQAIVYIMRMLGYKDIAELKDTYRTDFVDESSINPDFIGYAAIAQGMGIFKGNAFMPKSYLTKGVAAEILYNLITS